jgi:hypothetical protein
LQNAPIASLLCQSEELSFWLSKRLEFWLEVDQAQQDLQGLQKAAKSANLRNLTRLQRSFMADRISAVTKDSTVYVSSFLSGILQDIQELLGSDLISASGWKVNSVPQSVKRNPLTALRFELLYSVPYSSTGDERSSWFPTTPLKMQNSKRTSTLGDNFSKERWQETAKGLS